MIKTKLVNYAYPTSDTAVKSGYGKTGCWFVELIDSANNREEIVFYSTDKIAVENRAATLPYNYNWMVIYLRKAFLRRLK